MWFVMDFSFLFCLKIYKKAIYFDLSKKFSVKLSVAEMPKLIKLHSIVKPLFVCLYFYSSACLFTQIEVCLTSIWDPPVLYVFFLLCLFWPVPVTRSISAYLRWVSVVEGTFQKFFMTLTPMFFLHIKLLGGPQDYFFSDHLEGKTWFWRQSFKTFFIALSFPTPPELITVGADSLICSFFYSQHRWCCLISSYTNQGKPSGIIQPWWKVKLGVTTVGTTK